MGWCRMLTCAPVLSFQMQEISAQQRPGMGNVRYFLICEQTVKQSSTVSSSLPCSLLNLDMNCG
jgi:hypothetical protein